MSKESSHRGDTTASTYIDPGADTKEGYAISKRSRTLARSVVGNDSVEDRVRQRCSVAVGDFSMAALLRFRHDPVPAALAALALHAPIITDIRMVQVGTRDEAWLLNPEYPEHFSAIAELTHIDGTRWHNAPFDSLSLEQDERLRLNAMQTLNAADDTEIKSRLLDPRDQKHGGKGHHLKGLCEQYLKLPVKDARASGSG